MERNNKRDAETNDQEKNTYSSDSTDGRYPGYPHYPASEDITSRENNTGKETLSEENITLPGDDSDNDNQNDDDVKMAAGTDADVTQEDLRMLDAAEQNMDTVDDVALETGSLDSVDEDGDPLNEEGSINEDMSGKDLDVPGSEDDDADEAIGEEDEENNYYSLGGDDHEAQEEDNFNS